jgi:hypothetical protein
MGAMAMHIEVTPGAGSTEVRISGVVDENAEFWALERLSGRVRIDLREVRRLNSYGCRKWVEAMRRLAGRAQPTFVACSPAVVDQLNTTYGFLGSGAVESFIGVMHCERCDKSFDHLFATREVRELDGLPEVACPKCRDVAALDDIEDSYLLFLREPTRTGDD